MPMAIPRLARRGLAWPDLPRLEQPHVDAAVMVAKASRWGDRRGSSSKRGYGYKWQKASAGHLRSHPLCCCCQANGQTAAAEVVDHIVPHRGDQAKFWDRNNWQALCKRCHDGIKQRLEEMFDRGEIGLSMLRLDRQMPELFG